MAHYEIPQLQELQENTKIPQEMQDIPQILAEKQARKLWTQPIIVNSKNPKILAAFREFHEDNQIHEQLVTAEEVDSKYGNVIWFLDRYLVDESAAINFN